MPVKSEKQRRFFEAVRHNPKFAKASGVPKSVANEFLAKSDTTKSYLDAVSKGDSEEITRAATNLRKD